VNRLFFLLLGGLALASLIGCGAAGGDKVTTAGMGNQQTIIVDGNQSCVRGQVKPNQVVMIGDSYLDPAYSETALDLFGDAQGVGALPANTTYRHYYGGGASMAGSSLQSNIPYQFTGRR
jgi:hypothetical protein